MEIEEFALARPCPHFLRILFGAAGAFAILMPVWEFRHAFLHPGWHSLFFGAITLGAWSVGVPFLIFSIFEEEQNWRVENGRITIARRNLHRSWTTVLRAGDILDTAIEERDREAGPNIFEVVLRTTAGEAFVTQGFEKRANAEELEARLRASLGLS